MKALARLWKTHESKRDINSEPVLLEEHEYMIWAYLRYIIYLEDRSSWLWTAIIRHTTKSHDDGACHTRHNMYSQYSYCRYAMVSNSVCSLLERYNRSDHNWLTQLCARSLSSCMLCCLSNNKVEVLNQWYAFIYRVMHEGSYWHENSASSWTNHNFCVH